MRLISATLSGLCLSAVAITTVLAGSHNSVVKIQFGTGVKHGKVTHQTSAIPVHSAVAWQAQVSKMSAGKVTVRLIQIKGPGPHPATVYSTSLKVSKGATRLIQLWSAHQLKKLGIKASTYQLVVSRGTKSVAQGQLQILRCGTCKGGNAGVY